MLVFLSATADEHRENRKGNERRDLVHCSLHLVKTTKENSHRGVMSFIGGLGWTDLRSFHVPKRTASSPKRISSTKGMTSGIRRSMRNTAAMRRKREDRKNTRLNSTH